MELHEMVTRFGEMVRQRDLLRLQLTELRKGRDTQPDQRELFDKAIAIVEKDLEYKEMEMAFEKIAVEHYFTKDI